MATKKTANTAAEQPQDLAAAPADDSEAVVDLRREKKVPAWVREVIETHLAIEQEDARSAGAIGFMHRALVNTAMPYKDPKSRIFERVNGTFRLTIMAGYEGGIPYGIYPRLLMSWVSTEVVRTNSPELELGESLAGFLRDVLDLERGGGVRGSSTRVTEMMKRLFGAQIIATDAGQRGRRPFRLKNLSVVDDVELDEVDFERRLGQHGAETADTQVPGDPTSEIELWTPQKRERGWRSRVMLTQYFFDELRRSPVPIDLRAYRALRGSPLAMDVYTWLTYRMSYLTRRCLIRWEALMSQFGSGYTGDRAVIDFRRNFLQALNVVLQVYKQANVLVEEKGIVLLPSPPHVSKSGGQLSLI